MGHQMSEPIGLTTGLGEVMAPQTLLSALVLAPDGAIRVDPGALHGRSEIESSVRLARRREELAEPQLWRLIWVAIELDEANRPVRYKGLAASELWIDRARDLGYKVLAEHVNRMSEALRGGLNLKALDQRAKQQIARQLESLSAEAWAKSAEPLRRALEA
jgi:hypothetical protein